MMMEGKLIVTTLAFMSLAIACTFASMSGFYIDNGHDKTVLHQELSPEDQMEVEHEILDLLGLPDRPRKKHPPSLE